MNKNIQTFLQSGYLEHQNEPRSDGSFLYYDVDSKIFTLKLHSCVKIKCAMQFTYYPFDTHHCNFVMVAPRGSEPSVYDKITLPRTSHEAFCFQELQTALKYGMDNNGINSNTTEMFAIKYGTLNHTEVLAYGSQYGTSITGFTVSMRRFPYPYIFDTFVPTELLTIISFIGFVVPVEMVPGRTGLLVTTFLMLVNINNMVQNRGPVVRS